LTDISEQTIFTILEEKMERLTKQLAKQTTESQKLEVTIKKNLEGLGYGL